MSQLVNTFSFPTGESLDYESEEELRELDVLRAEAWRYLHTYSWDPPIADLVLAFGVAPVVALFLARRRPGARPEDAERWVVVGDLPSMHLRRTTRRRRLLPCSCTAPSRRIGRTMFLRAAIFRRAIRFRSIRPLNWPRISWAASISFGRGLFPWRRGMSRRQLIC